MYKLHRLEATYKDTIFGSLLIVCAKYYERCTMFDKPTLPEF